MIKIGRNDPCPCGSGKKYKKCCYNDAEKNSKIERAQKKAETKEDLIKFINEKIAVYVFKVELISMFVRQKDFEWDKNGIWRIIEIKGDQTLSDFHMAIQNAFNWDNDHMYSFFLSNKKWDRMTEYSGNPIEAEGDDLEIRDMGLRVSKKIKYLFDYGDELEHEIQLKRIMEEPDLTILYPRIIKENGTAPLQYGDYDE